jgi:putative membrane protein
VSIADFPALNAVLNGLSAVLLFAGWICIRNLKIRAHATLMISAGVTSAAFLTCYLIYHAKFGERSSGLPPSALRTVYYLILFPHLIMAIVMLPMIGMTFYRATRRDFVRHRKIARPTFWIWLYVSVSGLVVYWMLYHVIPAAQAGG